VEAVLKSSDKPQPAWLPIHVTVWFGRFGSQNLLGISIRDGERGAPAGKLPGLPTYKWGQNVGVIIGDIVLVNSGFRTRKNSFENYTQFGHALSKMFASAVLGQKSLKSNGFKGRQIIGLPRAQK
jgi:hypothetical protein